MSLGREEMYVKDDSGGGGSEQVASTGQRPPKQMTVVSANLQELYDVEDNADLSDLKAFAKRVAEVVPAVPDVLLLQEVLATGSTVVARTLSEIFSLPFKVVVEPGSVPYSSESATHEIVRDTGILINSKTMKVKRKGGFVSTRQETKHDAPDSPRNKAKDHAYMLATHTASRVDVSLMSVHLIPNRWLASKDTGYRLRGEWVKELSDFLEAKFPPSKHLVRVMAGDFNNDRSVGRHERIDSEVYPFWTALTEDCAMDDAVFVKHGRSDRSIKEQSRRGDKDGRRIDYIFSDAEVADASHDLDYFAQPGDPGFYSDHRFLWATLNLPKGAPRKAS